MSKKGLPIQEALYFYVCDCSWKHIHSLSGLCLADGVVLMEKTAVDCSRERVYVILAWVLHKMRDRPVNSLKSSRFAGFFLRLR